MDVMNLLTLFGGLGLFLYGMKIMGDGLELAAGSKLRKLIEKLTKNKYIGALVGVVVTAVIQSSSATTVMVVGFVNAGLMNLTQATGVIMGANVGTTITSLLIALKVDAIAPIAIFIGVVLIVFTKRNNTKHIGQIIAGLGILFLGMSTMSTAMAPLKDVDWFINMMSAFQDNPFLAILAGAILTAVIQSSSASVGILQALSSQGLIGLGGAVYVLYGQNIGTCITALIASIGTNKNAKKAAIVHLLFNVIGTGIFVIITLIFKDYLIGFVEDMFPVNHEIIKGLTAEQLALPEYANEAAIAAANTKNALAQISLVHIVFNIVAVVILLPMSNILVRLANLIIPGEDKKREGMKLKYLDERILNTAPIAVAQVLKEVDRMADITKENVENVLIPFIEHENNKTSKELRTKEARAKENRIKNACELVLANEKVVNYLNHTITEYLVQINALEIGDKDTRTIGALFHVVNDIERISDHCENIIETAEIIERDKLKLSETAVKELEIVHKDVCDIMDAAFHVFREQISDQQILDKITDMEEEIDDKTKEYKDNHVQRLNKKDCNAMTGVLFADILSNFERMSDHAANVAYAFADNEN